VTRVGGETINFAPASRSNSHTKYTEKQLTDFPLLRMNFYFMQRVKFPGTKLIQAARS